MSGNMSTTTKGPVPDDAEPFTHGATGAPCETSDSGPNEDALRAAEASMSLDPQARRSARSAATMEDA